MGQFVVVPGAAGGALPELRDILNRRIAEETSPEDNHIGFPRWRTAEGGGRGPRAEGGGWSAVPQHLTDQHNMLHWGKPLRDLLTCEAIYPKLQDLLGQNFRLDHIYAKVHRPGSGGGGLHEIGISGGGMYAYRYGMNSDGGGRFQNGMVVVAFELEDVHPGDGGLGVRRPFICTLRFCQRVSNSQAIFLEGCAGLA